MTISNQAISEKNQKTYHHQAIFVKNMISVDEGNETEGILFWDNIFTVLLTLVTYFSTAARRELV